MSDIANSQTVDHHVFQIYSFGNSYFSGCYFQNIAVERQKYLMLFIAHIKSQLGIMFHLSESASNRQKPGRISKSNHQSQIISGSVARYMEGISNLRISDSGA